MEITVRIPDELAAQAKARGLEVQDYVEELLAQRANARSTTRQVRTPEQIRAWLDSLAQFSDKTLHFQRPFRENGFTRTGTKWQLIRVW